MSDLNVGIVGLGWVAGAHIDAICSRREHDEGDLSAQFGTPLKAYTDYDAMLAPKEGRSGSPSWGSGASQP